MSINKPLFTETVYFQNGSSNKQYTVEVRKQGRKFVVAALFGRIGGTQQEDVKDEQYTIPAAAKSVALELIESKRRKGYTGKLRKTAGKAMSASVRGPRFAAAMPVDARRTAKAAKKQAPAKPTKQAPAPVDANAVIADHYLMQEEAIEMFPVGTPVKVEIEKCEMCKGGIRNNELCDYCEGSAKQATIIGPKHNYAVRMENIRMKTEKRQQQDRKRADARSKKAAVTASAPVASFRHAAPRRGTALKGKVTFSGAPKKAARR
jgi:predicted DNA-binding WGR domain protein